MVNTDFNPRAPCGARQRHFLILAEVDGISIHAPRVGRDGIRDLQHAQPYDFNPRAPCGARHRFHSAGAVELIFQSTRPVWGATQEITEVQTSPRISIHAPRVGRDAPYLSEDRCSGKFQSTRPVWGATLIRRDETRASEFQSTRPVWGATPASTLPYGRLQISIHAPRVGRDRCP